MRRLRAERGMALTVALFTLAVIALFTALVASTAGQLGDTSNRDRDSKRALGAAEAGINTALHRLNHAATPLGNLMCFTDVDLGVLVAPEVYPEILTSSGTLSVEAGGCPGASGRAGNGGTYTYWITLLNNHQHCDEQYTTEAELSNLLSLGAGGISVLRRCITSIGVVNGVQRRLQREIYSEFRLFHGLVGSDEVVVEALADVGTSHVGSNDRVRMEPTSLFGGQAELYDGAKNEIEATGLWGVTRRSDPWVLDPVDVDYQTADLPDVDCVGPLILVPCSPTTAGFDTTSQRIRVPAGYTVTLGSGDYYICQLSVTGGTLLVSGQARVFIDDDGCSATGLSITSGLVNTGGVLDARDLQVFVEGGTAVNIGSGAGLTQANLTLYAPESGVTVGGGVIPPIVKGSISAKTIAIKQGATFVGDVMLDIKTPFEQIAGRWHAGNWSECPPKPSEDGDPHSGCNG